jgi:hypothetical protein
MASNDEPNAPMIGQFSGPSENAPRVALRRKKKVEKVAETLEGQTEDTKLEPDTKDEQEVRSKPDTPKTAEELEEEFLDGLKSAGLKPEKARAIMDEVLQKNYYSETHKIRDTVIVIRSRGYRDTLRTQRYLEVEAPTYALNMDEIVMRYNTSASLAQFGDRIFEYPEDRDDSTQAQIEDAFELRRKFVERLPSVLVGKLQTLVYNMDVKLSAVFAEGAPADF